MFYQDLEKSETQRYKNENGKKTYEPLDKTMKVMGLIGCGFLVTYKIYSMIYARDAGSVISIGSRLLGLAQEMQYIVRYL